jgi:hypothetical protein
MVRINIIPSLAYSCGQRSCPVARKRILIKETLMQTKAIAGMLALLVVGIVGSPAVVGA